ncbi:hypothetical protein [Acinetobacter sp.]|uniref:hypothetical protein n=1 Tax=Acinetobacter sp. TaxID=472 RepID=UPI0031D60491
MEIYKIQKVTDELTLHVIHLKDYDTNFIENLNNKLVKICEGDSDSTIELVKIRLKQFLESKDLRQKQGSIAEFFVHLYLNNNEYKPEFIFYNLEESSIKKGFDGFYSKDDNTYIVESKSGSSLSKGISHIRKIKEAYADIEKYLNGTNGKGKNNPWKNAYYHANLLDVGTNKTIRTKIKELRDNYDMKIFSDIKYFNVMPCSTIFLENIWDDKWSDEFIGDLENLKKLSGKTINLIVVTKKDLQSFEDYLGL